MQNSSVLQLSLLSEALEIKVEPLKTPILKWISNYDWLKCPKRSEKPLTDAITVYTDAGKRSRKAAATWYENNQWHHQILPAKTGDSLQTLELAAVVWVCTQWMHTRLNIVTDSMYVAGIVSQIEDARLKELQNQRLFELLRQLLSATQQRTQPYCIIHIRSHKWSEGLGEGNARADQLVSVAAPINEFVKARESHNTFHQNARGLHRQFNITMEEARGIVRACPTIMDRV